MTDNILTSLSPDTLRRAAEIREQMTALEAELAALVQGAGSAAVTAPAKSKKTRSAKKKRAAKKKAAAAPAPKKASKKKAAKKKAAKKKAGGKRKISPEGIARIREAQIKRWAAAKAKKAGS